MLLSVEARPSNRLQSLWTFSIHKYPDSTPIEPLVSDCLGHFILMPIRHRRFTGRKRVAGTRTQNAVVLGSTGLIAKQWRTAGRIFIYQLLKIIIMGGLFQVHHQMIITLLKKLQSFSSQSVEIQLTMIVWRD